MKNGTISLALIFWITVSLQDKLSAQSINGTQIDGRQNSNILTAVPFLMIMPQARSGAMGNAGVALDADANASAINSAAFAFLPEGTLGASVTYSPWLKILCQT